MKILYKIRSFLIRLLAGKQISVILNTDIDAKKGIILNQKYYIMYNVNLDKFETYFTCNNNTVTIENKNVSALNSNNNIKFNKEV
jgi:hypothetical protein